MKELQVTVALLRHSGGAWVLEVDDAASRKRLLTVENIGDAEVAKMLAHHITDTPFPAKLNTSEDIGKRHECMTVLVPLEKVERWDDKDAEAARYQARAEINNPGWKADREGWNSHRRSNGFYTVTLRRYTEVPRG